MSIECIQDAKLEDTGFNYTMSLIQGKYKMFILYALAWFGIVRFNEMKNEVTNVYTVGATAFALFGGYNRTIDKWQLFPIYLTEHDDSWAIWFAEEELILKEHLPAKWVKRNSHIGSTAVKGIWAKPIIDILVEVTPESDLRQVKIILEKTGYLCMSESSNRLSFNKGYTENGFAERVFHLHLRKAGDNDELYFRDYLNAHPDAAKEYEKLKLSLWKQYEYDRDGYTESKTAFVKEYTQRAKVEFEDRYTQ